MTNKQKLEYFKTVESKLKELLINNKGKLSDSDYESFNIKGDDIILFEENFRNKWFEYHVFNFDNIPEVKEERPYLSDGDIDFLALSQEHNSIVDEDDIYLEFETFSRAIQQGVSLSINLKKKIKRATKTHQYLNPFEKATVDNEIIGLSKELILSNKMINQFIIKMFNFCDDNLIFWHNCTVDVYRNFYHQIKENYLKEFPNSNELDFLKSEYKHFFAEEINSLNVNYNFLDTDFKDSLLMFDYVSLLDNKNKEFLNLVRQRKLDFITEEIFKKGYTPEVLQKKKEIKINLIPLPEDSTETDDDIALNLSQLPNYNLAERYEMLIQLGIENIISKLDTSKKSKNMILGLIMGVSVENAKKLLDGTYKVNIDKEKEKNRKAEITREIEGFFERNKIILKK